MNAWCPLFVRQIYFSLGVLTLDGGTDYSCGCKFKGRYQLERYVLRTPDCNIIKDTRALNRISERYKGPHNIGTLQNTHKGRYIIKETPVTKDASMVIIRKEKVSWLCLTFSFS